MIFRRFPYTTLNDINLDWIIKQVKQIAAALQGKQDKPDLPGVAGQVLGLDENLDPVWVDQGGGGGGTTNYNSLSNKPQINGVTLAGNKTAAELGIVATADLPSAYQEAPTMDGVATPGTTLKRFAMGDHVHPSDTSRVSKSGDTMTGALRFGISDNMPLGVLTYYSDNDNRSGLMLYGYRAATATLNAIRLLFNSAGDMIVELSSPAAWRTALSLGAVALDNIVPITHGGTGQTGVATFNVVADILDSFESSLISIANIDIAQWGKVVQFRLQVTAEQTIAANTAIARLKQAYRPKMPTALYEIANRNSGYISYSTGDIIINNEMAQGVGRGLLATWILP